MRRVLFHWRGRAVWSYPVMLWLGLVLGAAAGNVAANRAGLPSGRIFAATFLLLIPALAGARLLFVATHWPAYRDARDRIWRRSEGGLSMYGGILLAILDPQRKIATAFGISCWPTTVAVGADGRVERVHIGPTR